MWNRDYEAEKAKYVDSMIFRIMELETENELLKERINSSGQAVQVQVQDNNVRYMVEDLRAKLDEANSKYRMVTQQYAELKAAHDASLYEVNSKYRMVTQQYAELKAAYDASNPKVSGLRKIAKLYANYGIIGIFKKIWRKIRNS